MGGRVGLSENAMVHPMPVFRGFLGPRDKAMLGPHPPEAEPAQPSGSGSAGETWDTGSLSTGC